MSMPNSPEPAPGEFVPPDILVERHNADLRRHQQAAYDILAPKFQGIIRLGQCIAEQKKARGGQVMPIHRQEYFPDDSIWNYELGQLSTIGAGEILYEAWLGQRAPGGGTSSIAPDGIALKEDGAVVRYHLLGQTLDSACETAIFGPDSLSIDPKVVEDIGEDGCIKAGNSPYRYPGSGAKFIEEFGIDPEAYDEDILKRAKDEFVKAERLHAALDHIWKETLET